MITEEEKNKLLFEYSIRHCSECKALILLKAKIEKMKKYCDCRYCKNYDCGDEFTVENTNKTLCVNCIENNKKFFEGKE